MGGEGRFGVALSTSIRGAGGEEGEKRGSRGCPAVSEARVRGGAGGRLEEMKLTGEPGLSAGEREGKGKEAGWAWPRKEKGGGAGNWAKQVEKRSGGRGKEFHFFSFFFK